MTTTPTPPAPPLSRWEGWRYVLPLFVASRLVLYAAALVLPYLLTPQAFSSGTAHETTWAQYWVRWDAHWYALIAQNGYFFRPDAASSVAFFPLMPLLMRPLLLCGLPAWGAGLLVANACTLGLLLIFHRWMRREFERPAIADTATALLAFCPQSCWFIIGYSEPLYLLTVVGALAAARRQSWGAAALWALAAGLTRSNGITLALPLLVVAAPTLRALWVERRLRAAPGPLLAVFASWCGHGAYLGFLWWRFGTWQANQITGRAGWSVGLALDRDHLLQKIPGVGFHLFAGQEPRDEWIVWSWFIALAASLLAAIVFWQKRRPFFWTAYLISFWSLFLLTAQADWLTLSMGRYAAALFPIAPAMALIADEHPWALPVFYAINAGIALFMAATVFAGYAYC